MLHLGPLGLIVRTEIRSYILEKVAGVPGVADGAAPRPLLRCMTKTRATQGGMVCIYIHGDYIVIGGDLGIGRSRICGERWIQFTLLRLCDASLCQQPEVQHSHF